MPETPNPPPEPNDKKPPPEPPKKFKGWKNLLIYGGILAVFYFGHVEIQTYLGEAALDKVALERVTLNEALKRSAASGRPVLMDVSAIWCPSCRKLDTQVLSDPSVQQTIEANYEFTRVEYESDEGVAVQKKYAIRGYPTLLILDSAGNKVRKLPLTFEPEAFKQLIGP